MSCEKGQLSQKMSSNAHTRWSGTASGQLKGPSVPASAPNDKLGGGGKKSEQSPKTQRLSLVQRQARFAANVNAGSSSNSGSGGGVSGRSGF